MSDAPRFFGADRKRPLCVNVDIMVLPPRSVFERERAGAIRFVKIDRGNAFRPYDTWVYEEVSPA